MTLGAIPLNTAGRAGKSCASIALDGLLDGESEFAVGGGRDRSRQVVGHVVDDNAASSHCSPVIPKDNSADTRAHITRLLTSKRRKSDPARSVAPACADWVPSFASLKRCRNCFVAPNYIRTFANIEKGTTTFHFGDDRSATQMVDAVTDLTLSDHTTRENASRGRERLVSL